MCNANHCVQNVFVYAKTIIFSYFENIWGPGTLAFIDVMRETKLVSNPDIYK